MMSRGCRMRRLQDAQDPVPAGRRSGVLKMRKAATAGTGAGLMDAAGERRHKKIPLLDQVACTRQIMASSRKSPIPGRNSANAPIYERSLRPPIACLCRPVNARMAGTVLAGRGALPAGAVDAGDAPHAASPSRPLPAGERRARRATVAGQRGRGLGRAGRWRRAARGLLKNVRAGRMGAGRMRAARDSAVPRPGGGPAAAHPRGGRESAPIRQALAGSGSACPVRDRAACVQVTAHGQEKNALAGS